MQLFTTSVVLYWWLLTLMILSNRSYIIAHSIETDSLACCPIAAQTYKITRKSRLAYLAGDRSSTWGDVSKIGNVFSAKQ